MNKAIEKFKKLTRIQQVEFVIASLLSLALLIALPVYAWFSYSNKVETLTKIKEPNLLDIRSGNAEPIVNFDLRDVNIEEMKDGTTYRYVFCVITEDSNISYDLQLAHTTNIPFDYKIYKAEKLDSKPADGTEYAEYHPLGEEENKTYYSKGDEVELTTLNADEASAATYGRTIAKQGQGEEWYDKTYDNGDTPQAYAVPLYLKTASPFKHEASNKDDPDYFILELTWNGSENDTTDYAQWNKAENNKETDIIYITAGRSSS